jgi:hypothetical protein
MSLEAQELQLKMQTPIWPYIKIVSEGTEIIFSSFIRKEIEGVMYKTLAQLKFKTFIGERIDTEELTIKFHDYCYKVLILGKPSIQEIDIDQRTEILRLAQELV